MDNTDFEAILQTLLLGKQLTSQELQFILPFDLNYDLEKIQDRVYLFREIYPLVKEKCHSFGFNDSDEIASNLWRLWLPLAVKLSQKRKKLGRTLIFGLLGGQGTGKTTLTKILDLIWAFFGYSSCSLSLDDLYKTYEERLNLREKDPRLIWRGPPGTHDVEIGIKILEELRALNPKYPLFIPRFDKSLWQGQGDRIEPEKIDKIDIFIFEGWFVGCRPIDDSIFDNLPPNFVDKINKFDIKFAREMNKNLTQYIPLWEKIDYLMVFVPLDYRFTKQWRKEAENKMIAEGKTGMTDAQIDNFVEYFWNALHPELFITPLSNNPNLTDLVVKINGDHTIDKIRAN